MGQKIDEALIRKRSEHNNGEISTLKEITLHQFDIEKIENLDIYCKQLEILFLQSNQISKIENLGKLKCLKYLQLALNNIKKIENLEGCESLEKLDLTVNFIDDLLSIECLRENIHLTQLFLVGNPCTAIEGYRYFVIASLPQLQALDGKDIEKSERILAQQQYSSIRQSLLARTAASESSELQEVPESSESHEGSDEQAVDVEKTRLDFQSRPVKHTPQSRLQTAKELEQLRGSKTANHLEKKKETVKKVYYGADGRVLQCNEAKYKYKWTETNSLIQLTVEISKFIDTSFIEVDVFPHHLVVAIKGKILRLLFSEPVVSSSVLCERSRLTGELVVSVEKEIKKGTDGLVGVDMVELVKSTKSPVTSLLANPAETSSGERRRKKGDGVVDYRNIVVDAARRERDGCGTGKQRIVGGIVELNGPHLRVDDDVDFEDDPDVPPLC